MAKRLFTSRIFIRIFVASLGITALMIVASLGFSAYRYEKELNNATAHRHDSVALRMAQEMALFFEQVSFQLTLTGDVLTNMSDDPIVLGSVLNETSLNIPHFATIRLIGEDGREMASSRLDPDHKNLAGTVIYSEAMKGKSWISGVRLNDDRVPIVVMTGPVMRMGRQEGFILSEVSLKSLWQWIDQINSDSGTQLSVSRSTDGLVIADQYKDAIGMIHPMWRLRKISGTVQTGDGSMFVSFHDVPGMDLTIVTQSRRKSFAQHLYQTRYQLFLFGSGLISLAALMSLVFSLTASNPIITIARGMDAFSRNEDFRIPPGMKGEYKLIADAFNRMAATIQEKQRELVRQESLVTVGRIASALAHELRHGLHLLSNMIYFIKDTDEDVKKDLEDTVQDMTKKVNDLMSFARSGQVNPENLDAVELLHETVGAMRYHTAAQAADIAVEEDGPLAIVADRMKLHTALSNMVRNSLEAGADQVRLSVRRVDGMAEFSVRDNGPGISEVDMEKVMEPFYTTKKSGFGIGLSMVDNLAKAHGGGAFIARSGPDGADIRFTIPLDVPPNPPGAADAELPLKARQILEKEEVNL